MRLRRNFVKSLKNIPRMSKRKQWEYKVLAWHELPEQGWLDGMGKDGWELVSVCRTDNALKYYFKRELIDNGD